MCSDTGERRNTGRIVIGRRLSAAGSACRGNASPCSAGAPSTEKEAERGHYPDQMARRWSFQHTLDSAPFGPILVCATTQTVLRKSVL